MVVSSAITTKIFRTRDENLASGSLWEADRSSFVPRERHTHTSKQPTDRGAEMRESFDALTIGGGAPSRRRSFVVSSTTNSVTRQPISLSFSPWHRKQWHKALSVPSARVRQTGFANLPSCRYVLSCVEKILVPWGKRRSLFLLEGI